MKLLAAAAALVQAVAALQPLDRRAAVQGFACLGGPLVIAPGTEGGYPATALLLGVDTDHINCF